MKHIPSISESEWQVMKVLWERSPLSAGQVVRSLSATGWSPKTVQTLLGRLVRKKAIGFQPAGRGYLYRPLFKEAECVRAENRSFVRRVYGGALMPMLAAFLEEHQLSPLEVEELKRILDGKGGER